MAKLRIETNKHERRKDSGTVAYLFVLAGGTFSMTEEWSSQDEIYAASIMVCPPARIWKLALPWLLKHAAHPPKVKEG